MELLGEDDVTGHDHVHTGQVLKVGVKILPEKIILLEIRNEVLRIFKERGSTNTRILKALKVEFY